MEKLFCPRCGTENPKDFKFCHNCGFAFETIFKRQIAASQAEVQTKQPIYFEEDKRSNVFRFVGLLMGIVSLISFFLPWIDLGLNLSIFGFNFSSFSGFSLPKLFSTIQLLTEKLKEINPDYDGGIPTLNGGKIMVSWNGAEMLYALPMLSIGISIASYLEWNVFKAFAGIFYVGILGMFIYVIAQFGIPLTSIIGVGLYIAIVCSIYFLFDFLFSF